jgi:hypothetical protein
VILPHFFPDVKPYTYEVNGAAVIPLVIYPLIARLIDFDL